MLYTIEVFKADRRVKAGERRVFKGDYEVENLSMFEHTVKHTWIGHRVEIHKTMVVRKNAMTGKEFEERYDTPWSCSPASESYWSL